MSLSVWIPSREIIYPRFFTRGTTVHAISPLEYAHSVKDTVALTISAWDFLSMRSAVAPPIAFSEHIAISEGVYLLCNLVTSAILMRPVEGKLCAFIVMPCLRMAHVQNFFRSTRIHWSWERPRLALTVTYTLWFLTLLLQLINRILIRCAAVSGLAQWMGLVGRLWYPRVQGSHAWPILIALQATRTLTLNANAVSLLKVSNIVTLKVVTKNGCLQPKM